MMTTCEFRNMMDNTIMEAQTRPRYNEFLKQWSKDNGITSFFGSDKADFLKDWSNVKTGGAKVVAPVVAPVVTPVIEKTLNRKFVSEQYNKLKTIEGEYYLQYYRNKVSKAPYMKEKAKKYNWLPTANPSELKTKYEETIVEFKKNPELVKEFVKNGNRDWARDLETDEDLNEQVEYILDSIKKMLKEKSVANFESIVRRVLENYFENMVRRVFPPNLKYE